MPRILLRSHREMVNLLLVEFEETLHERQTLPRRDRFDLLRFRSKLLSRFQTRRLRIGDGLHTLLNGLQSLGDVELLPACQQRVD